VKAPVPTTHEALLSFDVEEWFHVLDSDLTPEERDWDGLPARSPELLRRLLDRLAQRPYRATFFVLGWFARLHPALVREVAAAGHEVASHSFRHPLLYRLDRRQVAAELAEGKDALEQVLGAPVLGFRAPGFSIREDNAWALDLVAEAGFRYDSSLFPATHGHGGYRAVPPEPHLLRTPSGASLAEVPISTVSALGVRLPFGGGGYFRLAPISLTLALAGAVARQGRPFVSYLHLRDFDPETPRLHLGPWRAFKCYVGLRGASDKLDRLLERYPPVRYGDWLQARGLLPPTAGDTVAR